MLWFISSALMEQTGSASAHGLTTAGWIFISLAWITIISVAAFCYSRVIRIAEANRRAEAGKATEWAALSSE